MMRVTIQSEPPVTLTGADAKEIVRKMKHLQWNVPDAKRDYMRECAERVQIQTGTRPRVRRGADAFLHDLRDMGLIQIDHTTTEG
jgi:hypothetical protein